MSTDTTEEAKPLRGRDRISYGLIWLFGWILALLPAVFSQALCEGMGAAVWRFSGRRRIILSQLERAFPERSLEWRCHIGRRHCARMIEMFLLIVVLRHWPERVVRQRFRIGQSLQDILDQHGGKRPIFFAIPHSALMESLTLIPLLATNCPPIITLYRPLDSAGAERYVNQARERWGADLVARREGLLKAKNLLTQEKGIVGVLFDQSPGALGHLLLFFNRVCTATNLPGLLIAKSKALPIFLHTNREGFWRGTIQGEILPESPSVPECVVTINRALEDHLSKNDEACANWLWAHKRWKGPQREPLSFHHRKSYLTEQMQMLGLETMPRRTRVALRLSARPELLSTARRLLHIIRSQRPDAVFWLLVPEDLHVEEWPEVDHIFTLPTETKARRTAASELRALSFDLLFSLDPQPDAVQENRSLKPQTSAGIVLEGSRRSYSYTATLSQDNYLQDPWSPWRELLPALGLPRDRLAQVEQSALNDPDFR